MNYFAQILGYLQSAAATLAAISPNGEVSADAKLAGIFASIAKSAVDAHNQANPSDPLDVTKLHVIDPV